MLLERGGTYPGASSTRRKRRSCFRSKAWYPFSLSSSLAVCTCRCSSSPRMAALPALRCWPCSAPLPWRSWSISRSSDSSAKCVRPDPRLVLEALCAVWRLRAWDRAFALVAQANGRALTVEHRSHREVGEEGGLFAHVPAAAAPNPQRSLGGDDRTEAVPLDLEAVAGRGW